jgi:competence protein ComEA
VRVALSDSPWTPVVAKVVLGAGAFVALALVGSGAALGWLPGSHGGAALAAMASGPPALTTAHAAPIAPKAETSASSAPAASSAPIAEDAGAPDVPAASGVTPDGKVVLNLATDDDLRRLPGIGPGRARSILALRAHLGRFSRPEDLLRVKGIGRKLLARIRPLLLVDAPASPKPKPSGG